MRDANRQVGRMQFVTADSQGTERVGGRLAADLRAGEIVLLSGDLGAGKTTFVRGVARALGVTAEVTSPSFAIANRYPVIDASAAPAGLTAVAHLDLYRLGGLAGEDPDLLADYLREDTVALVEWPGGAEADIADFGPIRFRVSIEHRGGDEREITVETD